MDFILDLVLVSISILMLWKGADWLVDAASEIAHSLKISDLVIGLTVVAFGTSAPEFAVTIRAAITGQTDISIGNVVGSNIFNLGFILGGTAMVRAINITPKLLYRDGIFLLIVTILIYILFFGFNGWDAADAIDVYEGSILFLALIGYIIFLFIKIVFLKRSRKLSPICELIEASIISDFIFFCFRFLFCFILKS